MAEKELRQEFEKWKQSLPQCAGYAGGCHGDWGAGHIESCPMFGKEFATMFDAFSAAYAAGERAKWISVEEKLPESSGEYLVVETGDIECSSADFFIEDGKFKWMTVRSFGQDCEERELCQVTHWMPLPEAPLPLSAQTEEIKK